MINHHLDTYRPAYYADSYDLEGKLIREWRKRVQENSLNSTTARFTRGRPTNSSKKIWDLLKKYVNSPVGAVPWQCQSSYIN